MNATMAQAIRNVAIVRTWPLVKYLNAIRAASVAAGEAKAAAASNSTYAGTVSGNPKTRTAAAIWAIIGGGEGCHLYAEYRPRHRRKYAG